MAKTQNKPVIQVQVPQDNDKSGNKTKSLIVEGIVSGGGIKVDDQDPRLGIMV